MALSFSALPFEHLINKSEIISRIQSGEGYADIAYDIVDKVDGYYSAYPEEQDYTFDAVYHRIVDIWES